jgi:Tol biopolymer transport system component
MHIKRYIFGFILLLVACQRGQQPPVTPRELPISGSAPGVAGRLVYANGAQFRIFEVSTGNIETLVTFPTTVWADGPVVSPDRARIAFAMYRPDSDAADASGGVDLMLMNADGTDQRAVLTHTQPNEWLSDAAWAPDGQTLFFTLRSPNVPPRIESVRIDGTQRRVVVPQGRNPSVSADGTQVAFLTDDKATGLEVLAVTSTTGGEIRPLFAGGTYQVLAAPRFAPDGKRILFSGVTDISNQQGQAPIDSNVLAWLRPRVAAAHGIPWDIWVINTDGSGRERLTDLQEDSPMAAWSHDGAHVAIKGELGLYLLDMPSKKLQRLAQELAGNGIDWLEP